MHSVLDGKSTVWGHPPKASMKYFKSIEELQQAQVSTCRRLGITVNVAEEIYRFFHKTEQ